MPDPSWRNKADFAFRRTIAHLDDAVLTLSPMKRALSPTSGGGLLLAPVAGGLVRQTDGDGNDLPDESFRGKSDTSVDPRFTRPDGGQVMNFSASMSIAVAQYTNPDTDLPYTAAQFAEKVGRFKRVDGSDLVPVVTLLRDGDTAGLEYEIVQVYPDVSSSVCLVTFNRRG